jgi:hypothetical protein
MAAMIRSALSPQSIGRFAYGRAWRFDGAAMPTDPFIREKFTRESSTARRAVREYFKRYPKEQFQTEIESWRYLPSQTIEFIMKRLREPVKKATEQ